MENKKNDKVIVAIGFGLIILVIIFTIFRSKLFSKNGPIDSVQDNQEDQLSVHQDDNSTISPINLNKKIMLDGKKESFTIIDIRSFESWARQHIVESVNITLNEFPVSSKIDPKLPIILVGENDDDKNIDEALKKLREEKIENVSVLSGGMDAWKQTVGASVTFGNPKSFTDQAKVSYLEPESLNDAISQKAPLFIVDVRSADEFAKGHITGAINIPFEQLEKRRFEITEKKIIVVGSNELQEFQASVQVYDMLLISPFVMKQAMPGWEKKGFAIVK